MPPFRALLLLTALAAPALAQTPPPKEVAPAPHSPDKPAVASDAAALDRLVIDEVKARTEIMKNLGHLSDTIGPRLTGSANLERANRYCEEVFKGYGLTNVHLEPWEIPVGWQRGTATMTLKTANSSRVLTVAARGWTPGTKGAVTGPVVVLEARTKSDLEKYKGKLQNAVLLRGKPADVAPVSDLSYGPGGSPKKDNPKKDREPKKDAAPKNAEAMPDTPKADEPKKDAPPKFEDFRAFQRELSDFYQSEGVAAIVSDAGKPHGLLVTTGGWREGDRATPQEPIPGLFMAHEHYALLHRLASRAKPGEEPKVTLEVSNTFVPGPITVYNTVGEITGATKPDEIVVIGAHLDSWDLASGTTDNGTGSSIVMEVARTLSTLAKAGHRPARTIRFVLFTGEEQGLYGSKRYCERHKDELAKHTLALVHDTGTGKVTGFGLQGRANILPILEPQLETLKTIDGWKGLNLDRMGGTDHLSFDAAGVPGFACRQDMDEYRLTHHTQSDTLDKAKEPNLIQGAQVIAITALRVANLPEMLPRMPKPEPKKGRGPGAE